MNSTKLPRKKIGLLKLFLEKRINLNFSKVEQKKSDKDPLIQLADLFAGFAWFSIIYGDECLKFIFNEENKNQGFLWGDLEDGKSDINKTKINRFL